MHLSLSLCEFSAKFDLRHKSLYDISDNNFISKAIIKSKTEKKYLCHPIQSVEAQSNNKTNSSYKECKWILFFNTYNRHVIVASYNLTKL